MGLGRSLNISLLSLRNISDEENKFFFLQLFYSVLVRHGIRPQQLGHTFQGGFSLEKFEFKVFSNVHLNDHNV